MADTAQRIVRLEPPRRPERLIELDTMGTVGDAARPLSTAERLLQITGVRRLIVVVVLCLAWQLYATWLNNNLLFPTLGETLEALYDSRGQRAAGPAHAHLLADPAHRLCGRARDRRHLHDAGDHHPRRHGFPLDPHRHVQSAAGDRAAAARAAVVRAWRQEPRIRDHPFGAVGGRAQHALGLHVSEPNPAHGGTELRPARNFLCGVPAGAGGVSLDPHRLEDRLGVRVAHADRRRTRVRRVVALGRAWLVHLREPQPA